MPRVWPGCWSEVPENASTKLDQIGASIASLRQRFRQAFALESETKMEDTSRDYILETLGFEAESIHTALRAWSYVIPYKWHPMTAPTTTTACDSMATYMGGCEIYPSVQVAAIWNLWRCYRLIVFKIILGCVEACAQNLHPDHIIRPSAANNRCEFYQEFQRVTDAICYSVPYHLGNRQTMAAISDIIDKSLKFPTYHDFDPEAINLPEHIRTGDFMSLQDHTHHVIMQGPWHILSTLTHVLSLFSKHDNDESDEGISGLEHMVRPGQLDWIREQVLRAAKLLNLELSHSGGVALGINTDKTKLNGSRRNGTPKSETWSHGDADRLVSRIRESFRFTSGS